MPPNITPDQPEQNQNPQQPPASTVIPDATPTPQPPVAQVSGSPEKGGNKKLMIGIIIGVILLLVVPMVLLTVFLAIPVLQRNAQRSQDIDTNSTTLASGSQCLVQSDFDNWYKNLYGSTATEGNFKFHDPMYMYTNNVHFPADSLDYKAYDNAGGVGVMADLANDPSVKSKQFTIHLYGGVGTSQADSDFANKRAEVVKADLVAAGVSAEKIVIDPPQAATDYEDSPDEVSKGMTRVVVLKFDPTCSLSGSEQ